MTIISKNYEGQIQITDEYPISSYGIPVVLFNGQTYGDADIVDEAGQEGELEHTIWTGKQAKHDIARREYADNAKMFNWILKGTGLESHEEFVAKREEDRKATAFLFL